MSQKLRRAIRAWKTYADMKKRTTIEKWAWWKKKVNGVEKNWQKEAFVYFRLEKHRLIILLTKFLTKEVDKSSSLLKGVALVDFVLIACVFTSQFLTLFLLYTFAHNTALLINNFRLKNSVWKLWTASMSDSCSKITTEMPFLQSSFHYFPLNNFYISSSQFPLMHI